VRAIDTNLIVRFVTLDDPDQSPRARAALLTGDLYLPTTVALEAEWVLRSAYGFKPEAIAVALDGLAGLAGLTLEDPTVLAQAIAWLREGMDFADAVHLASADGCEAMLSFDDDFAKAAKRCGTMPVVVP
jgi:predicted nucleic-acid-binding protein